MTISSVIVVYGRPERSSSRMDVRQRLNSAAHFSTVENEMEKFFKVESNSVCMSIGIKLFKTKYCDFLHFLENIKTYLPH